MAKTSNPTEAEARPTVEVIYVGRRRTTDGKVAYFLQVPWREPDDLVSYGIKKNPGPIGGAYSVEHDGNPDEGIYTGTMHYIGQAGDVDDETRRQWAADDRAAELHDKAAKVMKRNDAESRDISGMTMAEAREWIGSARGGARSARFAVALRELGVW